MNGAGGGIEGLCCAVTTLGSLTKIEEDDGIDRLDCTLTILGSLD